MIFQRKKRKTVIKDAKQRLIWAPDTSKDII